MLVTYRLGYSLYSLSENSAACSNFKKAKADISYLSFQVLVATYVGLNDDGILQSFSFILSNKRTHFRSNETTAAISTDTREANSLLSRQLNISAYFSLSSYLLFIFHLNWLCTVVRLDFKLCN